jgi:ketosteroid isomerase-like protein
MMRQLSALVLVTASLLSGCAEDVAGPAPAEAVADRAMDRFMSAWRTGDWRPFLEMTTSEFSFWFPVGPHAGKHEGVAGRDVLGKWALENGASGARLEGVVNSRVATGSQVVYQTEGTGTAGPALNYRNWEVIVLTVSGDRISGLHEYWGSLPSS